MAARGALTSSSAANGSGGIARLPALIMLAAAVAAPWFVEDYRLFQFSSALVYATALLGLNLLIGYSGQISLGHGAFMALGGYGAAMLVKFAGLPYALAVPMAAVACLIVGLLIGLPALRFAGPYLALCTFALAVAVPQLLKAHALEGLTGGVGGLTLPKPALLAAWQVNADQLLYAVSLLIFLAAYAFVRKLMAGRVGRSLIALRDHPAAAACMGIDVARHKVLAFGCAAFFAGLAGAWGAVLVQYVAPDSYSIFLSISLLVGAVVGGLSRPLGAVLGALFIQFVPDVAESFSKSAPWAIYGVVVVLFALALPAGLAGLIEQALERIAAAWRTLVGRRAGAAMPRRQS